MDVSRKEQVEELANKIQSEVGDVNILVNNAGVLYCRPFVQWTPNQIEQVVQTNLMGKTNLLPFKSYVPYFGFPYLKLINNISFLNSGQLWMLKTFLPRMIEMDRGIIVSLTSIAGYVGAPNMVPYAASKFAVRGMMEALYMELRYLFRYQNIANKNLNYYGMQISLHNKQMKCFLQARKSKA